ncbi:MAG: DUF2889 domain-containing protein [Acidimicrobiales bacterium]
MFPDADRSVYRRRIDIDPSPTTIGAEMEDHHHHFRVELDHDGAVVTGARASGIRAPWETCSVGGDAIASMIGLTIDDACNPRSWAADRSLHCTHVADLALLAARHARDAPLRYAVRIWPAARVHRMATLERDGKEVMRWELDGRTVAGPAPWYGISLERDEFLPWIRSTFDAAGVEAAMILRRAASISIGNGFDLDEYATAADVHPADNTCHTYRSEVALTARRTVGSSRALEWI